ncbi:MAG: hypothetical protein OXE99_04800 [Cellvibrionales bacterium]|nr:hypothetical protein [Cellvibrionales bacterium]
MPKLLYLLSVGAICTIPFTQAETSIIGDNGHLTVVTDVDNVKFIEIKGPKNYSLKSNSLSVNPVKLLKDGIYELSISASLGKVRLKADPTVGRGADTPRRGEIVQVVETVRFGIESGEVTSLSDEME